MEPTTTFKSPVRVVVTAKAMVAELAALSEWADAIDIIFAWASSSGGNAPHWKAIDLSKVRRAIIGVHFNQTEPEALRALMDLGVVRVFVGSDGVFHPKVVVGVKGKTHRVILGSSNFTGGGYGSNVEVNAVIEGDLASEPIAAIVGFANAQWKHRKTFKPDEKWLKKYEAAWRDRPKPPKTPRPPDPVGLPMAEADLDVDFENFYELILSQENRLLADQDTIRVFDAPDSSYLQEAEACQAAFAAHPAFAKMPEDSRRLVAGWGDDTSGYFGRMTGAGYFKQMALEDPAAIGKHLDRLPLAGKVTKVLAQEVLEGLLSLNGVGLGVATRLLTVKRPDLFLTVNNANRERLREVMGGSPTTVGGYIKLHERLWALPWFSATEPEDQDRQRVWAARVGLLDALLYEPKG